MLREFKWFATNHLPGEWQSDLEPTLTQVGITLRTHGQCFLEPCGDQLRVWRASSGMTQVLDLPHPLCPGMVLVHGPLGKEAWRWHFKQFIRSSSGGSLCYWQGSEVQGKARWMFWFFLLISVISVSHYNGLGRGFCLDLILDLCMCVHRNTCTYF